jgi:uncharacterized protein
MTTRTVLDTNTIISALLVPTSVPRQAVDAAFAGGAVLVADTTLAELTEVIQRPRFDRYITIEDRIRFLSHFVSNATLVTVTEVITDCRDPKDDKFLEVAIAGSATDIVSGDEDLLVLNPYRGIAIRTPREYVAQYATAAT